MESEYLYHGTIAQFVPSILAEGLQPKQENAWDGDIPGFITYNPKRDDKPGFVYLASNEAWAARYAKGKADYFKAKPGERVYIGTLEMIKGQNAPVIEDAVATVLRIKATPQLRVQLEDDENDWAADKLKGTVPPELITVDDNPSLQIPLALRLID